MLKQSEILIERPFIVTINPELTVWLFVFAERRQSQNAANKLKELR